MVLQAPRYNQFGHFSPLDAIIIWVFAPKTQLFVHNPLGTINAPPQGVFTH